jgi:hypothetical protein
MNRKAVSLDELYGYLKGFHLSNSLFNIGALNAGLKYGFKKYPPNTPDNVVKWLDFYADKIISTVELTLTLSRLARFLILSGANDYREKYLVPGSPEFAHALNMVGELYEGDIETGLIGKASIDRLLGRLSSWQFPLQADRLSIIGRGYLLFIKIPQSIEVEYSIDGKLKEYFDIGAFEFMTAGVTLWMMTNGLR